MSKKLAKQLLLILCFSVTAMIYTGCGNRTTDRTSDEGAATTVQPEGTVQDNLNGTDTSAQDNDGANIGEDIGNAAEDVADGVGNAVDDLAGVDYSNYDSAHEYLLGQLGGTEGTGQYEIRNEDREVKNYDTSDTSKKGYRYEVYDTSSGEGKQYGVFYVDQETGKIYKESENGNKVEEYKSK